jgi:Protein of unknown function (DUF3306)
VDDKEPFLSRWSRRKLEAKEDAPAGAPQAAEFAPAPQAVDLPAAAPVAPLRRATQPPATGTAERMSAEYREFFDPQVDEKLRRTALKKLFSDPQFNVMDGLDTYIDDYSKPDPIPAAMLRQLHQAKGLFLFDDEKQASESASDEASAAAIEVSAATEGAGPAAPVAPTDTGALPEPPPPSASDELAGTATSAAAAPPREGIRNG